MWFYYFICLSVVLSFHDGVVDAGLSLFSKKNEPNAQKCEDSKTFDCTSLTPSRCFNGIFPEEMIRTCPKTCNVCKELGLVE
ncbi:unnamed protein product [Haemonchus placei]|uniref:ShKT domain-containing protein n=1 Tax=Haemonchus placei TaxID=6290 RepID=A0A0N4WY81_HAEPC|nr:unnamed protein product [Haemonchus placei]